MDIFSDKLLVNLRILSKIPKNGRITRSIDGVISLENYGYLVSFKRFLTADSRKQTLIEIDKILSSCISKFKEILHKRSSSKELLEILQKEIEHSTAGLENLKTTYQDDQSMVSHLDIFLLKTYTLISEIKECIETLKASSTSVQFPEVRINL
jgi:transcription elongation factor GreA-like protein